MKIDISAEERSMLVSALACQESVLDRRINKEANPAIKDILRAEHTQLGNLRNKLFSLTLV